MESRDEDGSEEELVFTERDIRIRNPGRCCSMSRSGCIYLRPRGDVVYIVVGQSISVAGRFLECTLDRTQRTTPRRIGETSCSFSSMDVEIPIFGCPCRGCPLLVRIVHSNTYHEGSVEPGFGFCKICCPSGQGMTSEIGQFFDDGSASTVFGLKFLFSLATSKQQK